MTDLDICKRIAEIEDTGEVGIPVGTQPVVKDNQGFMYRNPLEDDALCFQLMVKYKVDISWQLKSEQWRTYIFENCATIKARAYSINPNKAICLCIIQAYKDK